MIAGGGERVTMRQVASYADASNLGPLKQTGNATTAADIRRKLGALERYCTEQNRPFDSILRTHITFPLVLAESCSAVNPLFQTLGPENGFSGTPADAISYFHELAGAGLRYFMSVIHPDDITTISLLAEKVIPEVEASALSRSM
jgi:hypothetical protein